MPPAHPAINATGTTRKGRASGMMLMGSIYAAIVLTVLLAGIALAPLVQRRFSGRWPLRLCLVFFRGHRPENRRSGRWPLRLCLVFFVWALAVFHVHTANPRRHNCA